MWRWMIFKIGLWPSHFGQHKSISGNCCPKKASGNNRSEEK
jgi:hypothetical protein